MRDIHQPPPGIKITQQRLECVNCHAQTHANCLCGMNYVPVLQRVTKYDKDNPGKSIRAAAADLGIPKSTVADARVRCPDRTGDTVTGRDNKTYPATKPREKTMSQQDELMAKLELQIINAGYETVVVQLSAHEAIERLEQARDNLRNMVDGFIPM